MAPFFTNGAICYVCITLILEAWHYFKSGKNKLYIYVVENTTKTNSKWRSYLTLILRSTESNYFNEVIHINLTVTLTIWWCMFYSLNVSDLNALFRFTGIFLKLSFKSFSYHTQSVTPPFFTFKRVVSKVWGLLSCLFYFLVELHAFHT